MNLKNSLRFTSLSLVFLFLFLFTACEKDVEPQSLDISQDIETFQKAEPGNLSDRDNGGGEPPQICRCSLEIQTVNINSANDPPTGDFSHYLLTGGDQCPGSNCFMMPIHAGAEDCGSYNPNCVYFIDDSIPSAYPAGPFEFNCHPLHTEIISFSWVPRIYDDGCINEQDDCTGTIKFRLICDDDIETTPFGCQGALNYGEWITITADGTEPSYLANVWFPECNCKPVEM